MSEVILVAARNIAYCGGRFGTDAMDPVPAADEALLLNVVVDDDVDVVVMVAARRPAVDVDKGNVDSDRTQKEEERQDDDPPLCCWYDVDEEDVIVDEAVDVLVEVNVRLTRTKSAVDKSSLLAG